MITVDEALAALFDLCSVMPVEYIPLRHAAGRVLAQNVTAQRTQPPFAASSMDGYALRRDEVEPDAMFKLVGEAAAGHRFEGTVKAGQAVRIFTGAPVPDGADFVVIQEDVTRRGNLITLGHAIGDKDNIRPAGGDFREGDPLIAPRLLRAVDVALLAAMNVTPVPVYRRPQIAIMATGDELVQPGEQPGPDQIIASNSYGLAAQLETLGADTRILPVARDNAPALKRAFELAKGADLILTIGGASVGDHDLVAPVAAELGMQQSFYKVAMRPGKPLMAGRLGPATLVGLPGNPVSALVCGTIFVAPMVRAMQGLGQHPAPCRRLPLSHDMPVGGPREHYMRAQVHDGTVTPANSQDSALLGVLARSDVLLIRPANAPEVKAGDLVDVISI